MSDSMEGFLTMYGVMAVFIFLLLLFAFVSSVESHPLHETPKKRARRILLMLGAVIVVPLIWPLALVWVTAVALGDLIVVAFGKED